MNEDEGQSFEDAMAELEEIQKRPDSNDDKNDKPKLPIDPVIKPGQSNVAVMDDNINDSNMEQGEIKQYPIQDLNFITELQKVKDKDGIDIRQLSIRLLLILAEDERDMYILKNDGRAYPRPEKGFAIAQLQPNSMTDIVTELKRLMDDDSIFWLYQHKKVIVMTPNGRQIIQDYTSISVWKYEENYEASYKLARQVDAPGFTDFELNGFIALGAIPRSFLLEKFYPDNARILKLPGYGD